MIRRYGEAVKSGQRYIRRPGVYAILLDGDHILATHQAAPVPEFQLPGGGIDKGEQPLPALHREVFEETGWKIAVTRQLGVFRRFTFMPCSVYLARPVLRLGPPSEAGHTAVWLPVRDAMTRLGNAGDRAMLARFLG